tara:strand:+ start:133 stop:327 length:195 start_codon:yes stop_codon:yes gene_type:complete
MSDITAFIGDNGTLDTVVHFEKDGQIVDTWYMDSDSRFDDYLDDDEFLRDVLLDFLCDPFLGDE